jgi:acyl carrier protein
MNTTEIDIITDVREFIKSNFLFNAHESVIGEDASFLECGIIDSTGILELIAFLQNQYKITIEDYEMLPENLDSLSKISRYIRSKLQVCEGRLSDSQ